MGGICTDGFLNVEVNFFQPLLYIKAGTALSDPGEVTVADDFGFRIVEAVDYDWLIEFKKSYRSNKLQPDENKKLGEGEFIALTVEENFVPEQQTPAGWQVERLILKSPTGDEMEIKCTNLFAVAELLRKMS